MKAAQLVHSKAVSLVFQKAELLGPVMAVPSGDEKAVY